MKIIQKKEAYNFCDDNNIFARNKTNSSSFCFSFFGFSFADIWGEREGRDPEEEGSGAVLFVYLWTLLLFAGLIFVGNTTGMTINKLQVLRLALFGFVNYCFVTIILLVGLEGAIETEGREIEEDGFYGQRAVLLLVTCFFAMVQSIVFISWTTKRLKHLYAAANKPDGYVDADYDGKNAAVTI